MKTTLLSTLISIAAVTEVAAQRIPTGNDWIDAYKVTNSVIPFDVNAEGKEFHVKWGMDTAWDDETNIRRGIAFIGKQQIELARASFTPNYDLTASGELSTQQRNKLQSRLNHINLIGKHVQILLNDDPGGSDGIVNQMYKTDPMNWARLINKTVEYTRDHGFTVVSIAPYNEPDYGWGQGDKADFLNICKAIRSGSFPQLDDIRLCGGNTLNDDRALEWYNYLKEYLEEGNTHQLAGSFANYANFFKQVTADGKIGTADELHNIGEAIIGMEYGMTQGIWWGFDGLARGELCRATFGKRLAYGEDRNNWTVGAVYRNTLDNRIEAFVGTSERQANKSSHLFVSTARDVYFDGYGPQRAFLIQTPGSSQYQTGQTNAERVVNITWGEDVQPSPINGTYLLMNYGTKLIMAPAGGSSSNGASIVQMTNTHRDYMQWTVQPIDSAHGGDFSYYTLKHTKSGKQADLWNWNIGAGASINLFSGDEGNNELYWFEYAGNGCYYIHNKHSNMVLGVANSTQGSQVITQTKATTTAAKNRQLWRLIPADAECELVPPSAPQGLTATPQSASIRLHWQANPETDVTGYTILRRKATDDMTDTDAEWNTIARNIPSTDFIDNTCHKGTAYIYKVKAVDKSVNTSDPSQEITASTLTDKRMICQLQFDNSLNDITVNQFDAKAAAEISYASTAVASMHKSGITALNLDGTRFVQLPYSIADMSEMTICCWMKLKTGNSNGVRLFDFGNGTDQCIYFTPSTGNDAKLVIKDKDEEQSLSAAKMTSTVWRHIAITFSSDSVSIYVNGEKVASSADISLRPSDICPTMCFLGRSQSVNDPLLKAYIDDFRVYNYALTQDEVAAVTSDLGEVASGIVVPQQSSDDQTKGKHPIGTFSINGQRIAAPQRGINVVNGKKVLIY